MGYKLLIINPGSTSTKIGLFDDETLLFEETLRHSTEEISRYNLIVDQMDFRKELILDFLKSKNFDVKEQIQFLKPGAKFEVGDALFERITPEKCQELKEKYGSQK